MRPRSVAILMTAAVGFAAFAYLYRPAMSQPAGFQRADRKTAESAAYQTVRSLLGTEPAPGTFVPKEEYNHSLRVWQHAHAKQSIDTMTSPLETRLKFRDSARHDIEVSLSSSGRVTRIRAERKGRNKPAATDRGELAQRAFRLLAGEFAAQFQEKEPAGNGLTRRWRATTSHSSLAWQIEVRFDAGGFVEAVLRPQFSDAFREEAARVTRGHGTAAQVISGVVYFAGSFIIGTVFAVAKLRKMVDSGSVRTAALLFFVSGLIAVWASSRTVSSFIGVTSSAMGFLFAFGAGLVHGRETEWARWSGARLFLQRRWLAKGTAEPIACGLLWSGAFAAIPLAVAQCGVFGTALLDQRDWSTDILRGMPALAILHPFFDPASLFLFVGLLPLLSARIGIRWISLLLFFPAAAGMHFLNSRFVAGLEAGIAAAAITAALSIVIYELHGALGVLVAGKGAAILFYCATLLLSGSAALQTAGYVVLGGTSILAGGAAYFARRGKEVEAEDVMASRFLSRRERLKAEFSVAQQAQQQLLPASPPELPGFRIAAACQPARDVGGDLYDYFQLADGRTGLCVADVSGKGMPAALYMTLTKGLLCAAAPAEKQLLRLAGHVNLHLRNACRRKMFVTAAFAAVDAETREVEYVRAGHNPAVLYEAASGKARLLHSRGLGLGLAGDAVFSRGTDAVCFSLSTGDVFVLYSDGVTEAMNRDKEQFGEERLLDCVERSAQSGAQAILEDVRDSVAAFSGTEPVHDDITLLVLSTE
ncbi:MAG: PP2C family protein-serine/threonine phosphatase [Candidatus Solibacter usitatus]|nr:PP2C family protein-serine/threonine phosphatase [Candidatus Solibacter usitatus]